MSNEGDPLFCTSEMWSVIIYNCNLTFKAQKIQEETFKTEYSFCKIVKGINLENWIIGRPSWFRFLRVFKVLTHKVTYDKAAKICCSWPYPIKLKGERSRRPWFPSWSPKVFPFSFTWADDTDESKFPELLTLFIKFSTKSQQRFFIGQQNGLLPIDKKRKYFTAEKAIRFYFDLRGFSF